MLSIVATPIGNLEDITLRAINVLSNADLILAEDTRVTRVLLDRYNIKKEILSYHQHSGFKKIDHIVLTKKCYDIDIITEFYNTIKSLSNINIIGLMCIAPDVPAEQARPYFRMMTAINKKLNLKYISMGMSNDFKIAIEEGATMIRVGSSIFI